MTNPLVSVHIISYNQKIFIRETLDSVLRQNYNNIEIIVADDGSTDGTQDIIIEYARKFSEKIIPIIGGSNLGITKNSNRGLARCSGKYIAFLGGDDLMSSEKISTQVQFMEAHSKCAICYHDLDVFDHQTGKTLFRFNKIHTPYTGSVAGVIKYGCFNGGSATMVRRSEVPTNGFDERLPVASDWCFWIETLLTNDGTINYINKILGSYRRHEKNITKMTELKTNLVIRDHIDTCAKVLMYYPEFAREALYRNATLLRSFRSIEKYDVYLIASLKTSFQVKTAVLYILSWFGYKKLIN